MGEGEFVVDKELYMISVAVKTRARHALITFTLFGVSGITRTDRIRIASLRARAPPRKRGFQKIFRQDRDRAREIPMKHDFPVFCLHVHEFPRTFSFLPGISLVETLIIS